MHPGPVVNPWLGDQIIQLRSVNTDAQLREMYRAAQEADLHAKVKAEPSLLEPRDGFDLPVFIRERLYDPYQQLYSTYSQVFLMDRVFSGRSDNPLTVLKHSPAADLTGKIDLGNKKYRLVINESGILVTVKKLTPTGEVTIMNNDKFFKKDELRIGWSKEFHVPGVETGTIQTLSHYLSVDENARTVTVLPVKLNPIRKEIQPQFIMNERPVQMEKIYCRTAFGDEVPYDAVMGVFRFEGENVKKN